MHRSAEYAGGLFFNEYAGGSRMPYQILDIGSSNINGSLKNVAPEKGIYTGADLMSGPGVDVVLNDPYHYPFSDSSFDFIVSSSCFEHDQFFWLSFIEIGRVLKSGGLFYLNVPSNGFYHRYPSDYWRFYPDAGKALEEWGKRNGYEIELIESFVLPQWKSELWNDFIAVFQKKPQDNSGVLPRMYRHFSGITNVWLKGEQYPQNENKLPEDRRKLVEAEYRMKKVSGGLIDPRNIETEKPVCNLCGGTEFIPGPNGRMADSGVPPCCRKCGSLERQRIVRRIFQGLPIGFLDWRKGLQFSPDNSLNPKWFREYEISIYGGENSMDIQSIDRNAADYNFVSFNHVLEFIPDACRAFDELFRILSPDGILQACFSSPLLRETSRDFEEPFGPHSAWHLFGKDIVSYFNLARKGIIALAIEETDPCTGVREVVHLFIRQPKDAMRIRGWLSAWSATVLVLP
ncbi:MAG: methyltransferase domain-containing protein [Nitrosomonas sp.]|nr:MAG: methyltransferase domain-containing protein [Nitrosomonas sp.]